MSTEIKKVPLSTDDLISLFDNPNQVINIDYINSTIKDEAFFTYVSNVKLTCNIVNYKDLSFEEKEKLLNTFINSKYTMEILTLKQALASVFLGLQCSDYFTAEELELYKTNNQTRIDEMAQFYHSMLIMIPSISNVFKDVILDAEIKNGTIKEIDGTDFITPNIYNMTFYPQFIDLFIGLCSKEYPLVMYKGVLDTYQYKNKGFFALLSDKETAPNLIALFNYFFTEDAESEKQFSQIA